MVLNRASRKEADLKLGTLRKQVSIHVFSHRFEDGICREVRQMAEELAEASSRLSVEINDAYESGDLLRKFRVDAIPALVVTAKDQGELRIYGLPLAYAYTGFLEAITLIGSPGDPKSELMDCFTSLGNVSQVHQAIHVDLVISRHELYSSDAAIALWRTVMAEKAAGQGCIVAALRIAEDCPYWAVQSKGESSPVFFVDGVQALSWPFTDMEIAQKICP